MRQPVGVCFDPETIELLRTVLDEAWNALSPSRQQTVLKSELADAFLLLPGSANVTRSGCAPLR